MKYIILLLSIPVFNFCQTATELDGTWVGAYQIIESNTNPRFRTVGPYIIEFQNGRCKTTYFDYKKTGVAHSYSEESFDYELANNQLINKSDKNAEALDVKTISSDSIVIGFPDENLDDVVLKKVKIEKSPTVNLINQAFVLKVEEFVDSIDFISDTTFLHIGEINQFREDRWLKYEHKGSTILVLFGYSTYIFFVEDIRQNSIKLKLYHTKEVDVELRNISKNQKIELVYGAWNELSTNVSGEIYNPPLPPGISEFDRKWNLIIDADSIEISHFKDCRKHYWTTNSTNQFLIIPDYYKTRHAYWKIIESTDKHLKIKKIHQPWDYTELETKDFERIKKSR